MIWRRAPATRRGNWSVKMTDFRVWMEWWKARRYRSNLSGIYDGCQLTILTPTSWNVILIESRNSFKRVELRIDQFVSFIVWFFCGHLVFPFKLNARDSCVVVMMVDGTCTQCTHSLHVVGSSLESKNPIECMHRKEISRDLAHSIFHILCTQQTL